MTAALRPAGTSTIIVPCLFLERVKDGEPVARCGAEARRSARPEFTNRCRRVPLRVTGDRQHHLERGRERRMREPEVDTGRIPKLLSITVAGTPARAS